MILTFDHGLTKNSSYLNETSSPAQTTNTAFNSLSILQPDPLFQFTETIFIMVCQHCTQLLGDYAKLVDNLQLILRLFKLTLEQNQSIKTAERLTMLQGHLIKNGKTLDDVIFILAVKCVGCGYVQAVPLHCRYSQGDPKTFIKQLKSSVIVFSLHQKMQYIK